MNFFQSIKFRFILACIAFSIIVTLCYGRVTFIGLQYNSDELFNWYITQEAEQLIKHYKENPQLDISQLTTANIEITTEQKMIAKLASYFPDQQFTANTLVNVHNIGPAFSTPQGYNIYEFGKHNTTIHILEAKLWPNSAEKFYYLVDVSAFRNYDNYSEEVIENMFLEMLALIIFIALIIGIMLAKTVVSPLSRLAKSVDNMDLNKTLSCKDSYFNDEIALLANKIESFAAKTRDFVEREKAFTHDASHELRTPVASSRAAIELALSTPEGQQGKVHDFLKRVERANKDMTHLIETFLMLGRENDEKVKRSAFNLHELVDNAFNKHNYLKRTHEVQCVNKITRDAHIINCKEYLSIILDNLIRNALQHTNQGQITVSMEGSCVVVSDTGDGLKQSTIHQLNVMEKSGVGLSIVRRLCEKQGWQLTLNSNNNQGTRACINIGN